MGGVLMSIVSVIFALLMVGQALAPNLPPAYIAPETISVEDANGVTHTNCKVIVMEPTSVVTCPDGYSETS